MNCRQGFTLTEIMVVVVLAVMVFGGVIFIWTRTGRTVIKGEKLMDLQLALRSINERLRSDFRTCISITDCSEKKLDFIARIKGEERRIKYEFDFYNRTLTRTSDAGESSDFHARGLVNSLEFSVDKTDNGMEFLRLAMELVSIDNKGVPAGRLAVVSQFASKSREEAFERIVD